MTLTQTIYPIQELKFHIITQCHTPMNLYRYCSIGPFRVYQYCILLCHGASRDPLARSCGACGILFASQLKSQKATAQIFGILSAFWRFPFLRCLSGLGTTWLGSTRPGNATHGQGVALKGDMKDVNNSIDMQICNFQEYRERDAWESHLWL